MTHYLEKELYEQVSSDPEIFRFLREGSLDGLWYWDLTKPEHEWMDESFWKTLGYDPAEKKHLSEEWQDLIFPEDLEKAIENFEKHCADSNHKYDQIVRYKHSNGHTVWIRCRGLAIRDKDGTPIRMLGAHTDITQLKEVEHALTKRVEELEVFSTAASHDLKSPIRNISHLTSFIEEDAGDALPEECREMLGKIKSSCNHLRTLIESLLKYSTLHHRELNFLPLKFSETVNRVVAQLSLVIDEQSAEISVAQDTVVLSDETLLHTILYNLISNALKFKDDERALSITLSAEKLGNQTVIKVQDSGRGIPSHLLDLIFKPLKSASQTKYRSHGLGLNIVSKAVECLDGTISVDSEVGVGTTFTVRL